MLQLPQMQSGAQIDHMLLQQETAHAKKSELMHPQLKTVLGRYKQANRTTAVATRQQPASHTPQHAAADIIIITDTWSLSSEQLAGQAPPHTQNPVFADAS
eukprot:GHRQ01028914.1.p3 GENE.GHRQ01028914.1~~GHRQ01028914.1.p3  ORF type:complete len:101 (+),score=23.90 GHRQ01028914.1:524-826(+)